MIKEAGGREMRERRVGKLCRETQRVEEKEEEEAGKECRYVLKRLLRRRQRRGRRKIIEHSNEL